MSSTARRGRARSRRRPLTVIVIALVLALAGVAAAATETGEPVKYMAPGGSEVGLRPTAIGLPSIGESSTVGAGELVSSLVKYHDSGQYESDLASVDGAAQRFLDAHLPSGHAKAAIVLDIDETSLSNYAGLLASGFTAEGTVITAVSASGTAIAPTLALYRDAIAHHVAVFFVTGRPPEIQEITETNLRNVGYNEGWNALYLKPTEADTEQFKSSTRAAIKKSGYRIVVNVGDQQSDLDGGFAQRDFKLPNPFYFIPD